MDKNMINIDDLLRQRMSDGEEKERPGAWLNMRDLLDQKMPVQQPGSAFNWRRMLGVITGVVAISAAGLGSYQAVTSFRNNADITNGATASVGTTPAGTGRLARIAANSEQQFGGKTAATATAVGGTTSGGNNANGSDNGSGKSSGANTTGVIATGTAAKTSSATAAHGQNTNRATSGSADNNIADLNATTGSALAVSGNNNHARIVASTAGTIDNIKSVPAENNQFGKSSSGTAAGNNNQLSVVKTGKKTARIAKNSIASKNNDNNTTNSGNTPVNSGTVISTPVVTAAKTKNAGSINKAKIGTGVAKTKIAGTGNTKTGTDKPTSQLDNSNVSSANPTGQDNNNVVVTKESIAKIEMKETYTRDGKTKLDTISIGTVERDKYVLASAGEQTPALSAQTSSAPDNVVVPAAAANTANEDFKGAVAPASKKRIGKKEPLWTPRKLEEMVHNTRVNMSQIRFYPGIVAGANTLFSSNPMAGFQAGLSGNLSLNERWGIFTEFKYVHRFGGKSMDVRDPGNIQQTVQNNTTTYSYTPTLIQYNIQSISALELPIAVRYSLDRINLFMGVNYAYYFTMQAPQNQTTLATITSSTEPKLQGTKLSDADFGSRYGMGYMLGIGYQVSPNMSLDTRLSAPVWGSSNTVGSRYVSDRVFTVPTVQVNFNYYFLSPKKVR